jgi:hypothetical protein
MTVTAVRRAAPPTLLIGSVRPSAPAAKQASDARLEKPAPAPVTDIVEEWGLQSFPASDAPANW